MRKGIRKIPPDTAELAAMLEKWLIAYGALERNDDSVPRLAVDWVGTGSSDSADRESSAFDKAIVEPSLKLLDRCR